MLSVPKKIVVPLLNWYESNKRDMPWRGSNNPYSIWVSEIMLQQTQVETVRPYYENFLKKLPTVKHLAQADEQTVLKLWEGLGYYTRARNLHQSAKKIVNEFGGSFPETYQEWLDLPGIGMYTAAAITSIAFNNSVAVVDGNVLRVVSRLTELEDDISSNKTKQNVFQSLTQIIPKKNQGEFNQALMELGALICKKQNPQCTICPINKYCQAFQNNTVKLFPKKKKSKLRPHKEIVVGVLVKNNKLLIAKRRTDQMLGGLWEFPGGKVEMGETKEEALVREFQEEVGLDIDVLQPFCEVDHAFTHFTISITAYLCNYKLGKAKALSGSKIKWITLKNIDQFPFPKANLTIIKELKKIMNEE